MASRGDADANRDQRVIWIIVAAAAGIGLAAAAGSVVDGTGTSASLAVASRPALVGLAVGLVIGGLIAWWWRSRNPVGTARRSGVQMIVVVTGCLGALIGSGNAPGDTVADSPAASDPLAIGDVTYQTQSGDTAAGTVSPLDLDGDGRADLISSRPVLAFDVDGDGVEDGRLRECSSQLESEIAPDSVAIDGDCSNAVEYLLPYDSATVLATRDVSDPVVLRPQRSANLTDVSETQVTIILLLGFGMLLAALWFFVQQADEVPLESDAFLLEARSLLDDEPEEEPGPEAVAEALARSLDALLGSTDPRDAIVAAYATLLDELDAVGLGRHPWEAPAEHCRRCLAEAQLPDGPVDALVDLFSRARFGQRPMTAADRDAAQTALAESVDILRHRSEVTIGPRA